MMKPVGRNMRKGTAAVAAVLGLLLGAAPASARGLPREMPMERPAHAAPDFGRTLPPVGFVMFCQRNPLACRRQHGGLARLHMNAERWRLAVKVNSFVNARVMPVSDEDLYGEDEYWAYPDDAGDCEDYALLKQRYLEGMGFARSALLLTVVLDEKRAGHAVLTLATDEGDFVLDNRHDSIRRWEAAGYAFLKRQSRQDPRLWVSLAPEQPMTPRMAAASGGD